VRRIGITGHQGLDATTKQLVRKQLSEEISNRAPVCAVSSLAEGADQIFAEQALNQGGSLIAVIPSAQYETSFAVPAALARFRQLKGRASQIVELDFDAPGEEAYWAAGKQVVELCAEMLAVWDGQKSGGLGGTADVVAFAREQDVPVTVIWPRGATRA
jgi:hypothetical protein